jgi:hypothetical protein
MKIKIFLRLIIFLVASGPAVLAQQFSLKKDLQKEWMVYEEKGYVPFAGREDAAQTIYFWLDAETYSADRLLLESPRHFDMFVNGQVAGDGKRLALRIDSLAKVFGTSNLLVGVRQDKIRTGGLTTVVEEPIQFSSAQNDLGLRQSTAFKDFVITGIIILLLMLVVIIRLNPKLATDYFSVTKIFSMREGDDNQLYSRIGNSVNILFYVYCSMLLGYYLVVIFHFIPDRYTLALSFQAKSFGMALLLWLELSVVILLVFLFKIVLVFGLSFLFGMREVAGIHFFNWVRLFLVIFGAMSMVLFVYYISHGQSEDFLSGLLRLLSWVMGGWMVLIFLKLSARMGHSMFHLFSYICATELIPFLITIKVLYN